MKTIAKFFLKNKALSWLLLGLILLGGIISYIGMGKLEDAPFTIKQAVVTTTYPGASPLEVQQQVTDVLEEAIQSLGELYYLKTENRAGLSKITVYVKKEIRADAMQQLWDKLRRKVGDAQSKLPAGAGTSVVNDDFGDVLGVFYALSSTTRTYRELENQAERIKNELLDVEDVARVELFGVQNRTIEIEADPALLAASGVTMADIAAAFDRQNRVVDAGAVETAHNRLRVEASGSFTTLEELENLTVVSRSGAYFRLGEIAAVSEAYLHPARSLMQTDGVPAVGIAISTVADGNVVDMAERVSARIGELADAMPEGYHLSVVYDQGRESAAANDGFVLNLIISVVTVVAVLLFFIGMKNGILIGSGLVFSIFGTLIYMYGTGIALQRMSLAAIIIAMGMLVDNAIVVYDATLVNMQRGMRKRTAILSAVGTTAMPLLGATLIAVLTFLPVYLSPHITGELLSSLFIVIAVFLLLSWVLAISQNVFFVQEFVRRPRPEELKGELFQGRLYDRFRRALRWTIRRRYAVLAGMLGLLLLSGMAFRMIPQQFMPLLNKQYFSVDMWLPEGTRVEETARQAEALADTLMRRAGVRHVSVFVGQTPPRYYLANAAYGPQSNYAQCLVEAESPSVARQMQAGYYACVTHLDHQIGRLLQALIENKLYDDTLILFVSDHGELLGDHHLFRKSRAYQGSSRIPFIVSGGAFHPDEPGSVRTDLVELRDVMPTLLEAAGAPVPDSVEGISVLKRAQGEAEEKPGRLREYLHGEHSLGEASSHWIVTETDKYIWYSQTGKEQYFRVDEDPNELHDRIGEEADAGRIEQLRGILIRELSGREEGYVKDGRLVTGCEPAILLK